MAVLAIGLTPIFPTIEVVPVVEIPDFDRITKSAADPRFTGAGPLANTVGNKLMTASTVSRPTANVPTLVLFNFVRPTECFIELSLYKLIDSYVHM
jgi:hypothetical protein